MTAWLPSALVNHLWQSTLFVAVVWLATLALRSNRARVRYWLWTAASVKFLIPASALVSLGEQFEWRTAPASVQPAVSFVMEDVLAPAVIAVVAPASISQPLFVLPWLLLAVWGTGAAVVLASWRRQWLPIRSTMRQATPVRLDARYDAADLVVMSTPSMLEPGVVGILRPVLLLPDGLADRLTSLQLRALIAHERCHVRCRDNLLAATQMVVEALFWFHPMVWWIGRRMIDERERACDEAVLRSGSRPRDYAEGILEVCRHSVASPLACVAGVSGSDLRRRVESIMRREIGRPMTGAGRCALACAAVAAIAAPVAGGALKPPAASQLQEAVPPQAPQAVTFETASVRVNTSGDRRISGGTRGRTYSATNMPLRPIISAAYGIQLQGFRLEGGPPWIGVGGQPGSGDRFDIVATLPDNTTVAQVPAMLRGLLAERFKLVVHTEVREAPAYALVLARSDGRLGPVLRKAAIDCEAAQAAGVVIPTPPAGERGPCDSEVGITGGGILGRGQRLTSLARMMTQFVGRVIVDRTGLTGGFDFELRFSEEATAAQTAGDGVSLFTALQEQLGLRLESARAPVEFVVIDSVERPTENRSPESARQATATPAAVRSSERCASEICAAVILSLAIRKLVPAGTSSRDGDYRITNPGVRGTRLAS